MSSSQNQWWQPRVTSEVNPITCGKFDVFLGQRVQKYPMPQMWLFLNLSLRKTSKNLPQIIRVTPEFNSGVTQRNTSGVNLGGHQWFQVDNTFAMSLVFLCCALGLAVSKFYGRVFNIITHRIIFILLKPYSITTKGKSLDIAVWQCRLECKHRLTK